MVLAANASETFHKLGISHSVSSFECSGNTVFLGTTQGYVFCGPPIARLTLRGQTVLNFLRNLTFLYPIFILYYICTDKCECRAYPFGFGSANLTHFLGGPGGSMAGPGLDGGCFMSLRNLSII